MPQKKFPGPYVLWVVIHARNLEKVERNIATALAERVDGIVLVDHLRHFDDLEECFRNARQEHPDLWIGARFGEGKSECDAMSAMVFSSVLHPDGVWFNDISMSDVVERDMARYIREAQRRNYSKAMLFGEISSFGEQADLRDHANVAQLAATFLDIVTVSGGAIGVPPDIERVHAMSKAVGNDRLAIASGITAANVGDYMPYAKYFLVGTGVSDSSDDDLPGDLNPELLHKLVTKLHRGADLLFPS